MENANAKNPSANILRKIFDALKRFWYVLPAVIVVFAVIGAIVGSKKVPTYTAKETVDYTAENVLDSNPASPAHINAARAYVGTVVEFAVQECVAERANYYYGEFLNSGKTLEEFLSALKNEQTTRAHYTFDRLTESDMSGKVLDVRYEQTLSDGSSAEYFYTGRLISSDPYKLTFKNGGTEFSVLKESFISARDTDFYKSEYTFDELFALKDKAVKISYADGRKFVTASGTVGITDENTLTVTGNDGVKTVSRDKFRRAVLPVGNYIYAGDVSIGYDSEDESLIFDVSYTDRNKSAVAGKIKVLVAAINDEAHVIKNDATGGVAVQYKYFKNVKIVLEDMNLRGISTNDARKSTTIKFALIGLAVGAVAIYVFCVADRTVKDKNELESLTDTSVLAYISKGDM